MKFLVIRFSSIGDIVLTSPVVRCLKQKFPDSEIHFLTKKIFSTIVDSNPYIDKVIYLQNELKNTIDDLRREGYDHVIDLHNNLRTSLIKKALKQVNFHSFDKLNSKKWLYTNFKINLLPHKHIVDRYMATVEKLGVANDQKGLDYFIPDSDVISEKDIPFSHSHGFIAVVIGAAHNTKKLPIAMLTALCEMIRYPIILLGGSEDFFNGERIAKPDNVKVYNSCGKFNLNESADIIRRAKLVITHDTGLMHIAAAFQKDI